VLFVLASRWRCEHNTRSAKDYYSAELVVSVIQETVMDYSRLRLFIL